MWFLVIGGIVLLLVSKRPAMGVTPVTIGLARPIGVAPPPLVYNAPPTILQVAPAITNYGQAPPTPAAANPERIAAVAAAKADDTLYARFQQLVDRAQLRSGPTQQQQWNSLLAGNVHGQVPDASYTPDSGNLAVSNIQNTIAVERSGANFVAGRTGVRE